MVARCLFRQGKAGFNGAAGGAFEAADAAGHVDFLVHFHAHRTAAAAEVAFHAFLGIEPEMKQAEPVEQRQQTAERTKNPAPRPVNEQARRRRTPAKCRSSTRSSSSRCRPSRFGRNKAGRLPARPPDKAGRWKPPVSQTECL